MSESSRSRTIRYLTGPSSEDWPLGVTGRIRRIRRSLEALEEESIRGREAVNSRQVQATEEEDPDGEGLLGWMLEGESRR